MTKLPTESKILSGKRETPPSFPPRTTRVCLYDWYRANTRVHGTTEIRNTGTRYSFMTLKDKELVLCPLIVLILIVLIVCPLIGLFLDWLCKELVLCPLIVD